MSRLLPNHHNNFLFGGYTQLMFLAKKVQPEWKDKVINKMLSQKSSKKQSKHPQRLITN